MVRMLISPKALGVLTTFSPEPASRRTYSSSTVKPWHTSPAKPPTAHPTTSAPLPEQLRSIMRLLPHSVVVCTATQPGPDGGPRAMTMSSFTSLTLSPTPLITFNVATPSRTLDAVRASGTFAIHVLAGDAAGAAVAAHFTRGNVGGHALEGLDGVTLVDGVLRGEGVLFALRCRVLEDATGGGLVRVRDHVIVVGEVEAMVPVAGEKGFGLVYADRRYRRVGEVLERE
ncbi:flavin reductase like domain-containing protein [Dactylonectria macrodidyma]|uniref:Flavin reductase like domain-containing protein n=1 Tax=Dactylonectria macrodidyma TaxID=307937 RepID=A0A9P9F3C2_9HYPO|nr:flavin reductase like domain-containing protein [Dactylonectria macrodidyma]